MKKKLLLLFLALLLPGLIFVFLKVFGKNQFDIPVYYQSNVDSLNAVCGTRYKQPYQLSDSLIHKIGWEKGSASLFVFTPEWKKSAEYKLFRESINADNCQVIEINGSVMDGELYQKWRRCVWMVPADKDIVLVDAERRVRGYYTSGKREEIDRLTIEAEILLKKF